MRSSAIKNRILQFLAVSAAICVICAIAMAENEEVSETKPLDERMQKTVSVEFRNTPIEDVIRIMADQTDVDIVKGPSVTGDVTATLTDVPLEEALDNILAAHGFGYIVDRNMIRIAPAAEITVEAERLVSKIYRITYADIKEVETSLKKFMSKRGSLSSSPGTSNIIITDTESKIKAIEDFLEEIDRITPQVLVEARIYDITSKDKLDFGIEWSAGRNTTYDTDTGKPDIETRSDPFITGGFTGTTAKTESITAGLRLGWLNPSIDVDFLLKAQQNVIKAKLLANPRVLVLDNETANFKIIDEIPYQQLSQTSGGGSMGTTSFKEVGVTLDVTPHIIMEDGLVRLKLKPEFSVKIGDVTFESVALEYPQPIVAKREADTTLLVKSGQTVVLGGLRKKDVTQQTNKIPLLGDIPLLGLLFRFEGEDTVISEIVVFVTPWIIEPPALPGPPVLSNLSETEKQQFEVTEFKGPEVAETRAEASKK